MSDTVRVRVSKTTKGGFIATCRRPRVTLEADTEEKIWKVIQEEFDVNKHHKRKGVWICSNKMGLKNEKKEEIKE